MTDQSNDPWGLLADELGVQSGDKAAPPPATPPKPAPPRSRPAPTETHHREPPKKSKSDWNALAGELGLEVPPEAESGPTDHDPVAELLGFPPPGSLPPPSARDERRGSADEYGEFDADDEAHNRPAARQRRDEEDDEASGRKSFDDTRPVYYDEPAEGGNARERSPTDEERTYRPARRGRGRGGRSRGGRDRADGGRSDRGGNRASGDRENRSGGQDRDRPANNADRPYMEREPQAENSFGQEAADEATRFVGDSASGNQERNRDEGSGRRRRRRRRGRGGRDRETQRPRESQAESARSEEDELPFLELVSDDDLLADHDASSDEVISADRARGDSVSFGDSPSLGHDHPADEGDEHDDAVLADAEGDEHHSGKSSVRDIVTWKDAIGLIIDGNMQNRSHAPQHGSHNSRNQHGGQGHGRGRGRGGRRR